jgi:tetratricopeptide (TPR) repeat protein
MSKRTIRRIFWILCAMFTFLCTPQKEIDAQVQPRLEGTIGSNSFTASLNRLRSYASSGDLETMLKEALTIMKSEPHMSYMARMELLSAYRQKNRLDELRESLLKELQADSGNASFYAALGEVYRAQGMPLKAINMYKEAVELNPKDAQMLSSLASLYFSLKSYEETVDLLNRIRSLQAGGFSQYSMLANCYVRLGQKDEAVKLANEVRMKVDNKERPMPPMILATSLATLGDIYVEIGQYDKAIQALLNAIELDSPLKGMFQTRLAMVYERAGKPELAEKMRVESIPEASRIGKNALDFTLQDLSGRNVRLSDFRGKTVLLDFWATWCGPCVAEIPSLEALHRKYKGNGLVVIGMNTENDHAMVRDYTKGKISYLVLLDAGEKSKEYGVQGIPTKIYIDAEGKIRYREVGFNPGKAGEADDRIKKLLQDPQGW